MVLSPQDPPAVGEAGKSRLVPHLGVWRGKGGITKWYLEERAARGRG